MELQAVCNADPRCAVPVQPARDVQGDAQFGERAAAEGVQAADDESGVVQRRGEVTHEVDLLTGRNRAHVLEVQGDVRLAPEQARPWNGGSCSQVELCLEEESGFDATSQVFVALKTQQIGRVDTVVQFGHSRSPLVGYPGDACVDQTVDGDTVLGKNRCHHAQSK